MQTDLYISDVQKGDVSVQREGKNTRDYVDSQMIWQWKNDVTILILYKNNAKKFRKKMRQRNRQNQTKTNSRNLTLEFRLPEEECG